MLFRSEATSTTDGSLQTDGGLSVVKDIVAGDDIKLLSDAAVIHFGTNSEITATHVHNVGLTLTHTATGDNTPMVLQLKSEEDAIVANEVIASLEFAAGDSDGTDGATVAAGIHAIAEDTFSASANATKLVFTTGVSETAASSATAKMTLSSAGLLTIADDFVIKDGGTIGVASDADSITIASDGVVTFSQAPVFPDGSIAVADLDIDGATDIGAAVVDADLFIIDDGAGGTNRKVTAARIKTYTNAGVSSAADDISAGDAAVVISTSSGNITIDAAANDSDIIFKGTDGGADLVFATIDGSAAGKTTFNDEIVSGAVITSGAGLVIADAGTIGSASDTDAIAIGSDGDVTLTQDLELQHDGAILSFGANDDVTLTHVHNTGLILNAAMVMQFRDSAINSGSPADGDLDINADDEIELNSTLIDVNGNLDVSGTGVIAGALTSAAFTASGIIKTDDTTAATSTTDGSLQTDGGLSVALDAVIGDDLIMLSDASVIHFGANSEITLTHVHDVGLTVTNTINGTDNRPTVLQLKSEEDAIVQDDVIASIELAAGDSDGTDGATVAAGIHAIAEGTFSASANATKLVFTTGVSETAASSATAKMTLSSAGLLTIADDFMIKDGGTIGVASVNDAITISSGGIVSFKDDILIKDGGTIGSASDADAIAIASNGVVTFSQAPVFPDGSINIADLDIDGATDIGAALADADLFIVDDGAGGTNRKSTLARLKTYMSAGSTVAADDINAGDAAVTITTSSGNITIDAAANDSDIILKGTDGGADTTFLTIDGSAAGEATFNAGIVIADAGNIGSASDKDAIAIASDGVVTMNQIPVFSAGINVSGGTIAGTLSTAAQGNITSLGTLTALTVDNVVINGATIGHGDDTDLMTVADGILTVAGEVSMTTLDIGGINVTSTAAELNVLDGITAVVGELNALDLGSTAVGTALADRKSVV